MLQELFITYCTNGTLIMNPFTLKVMFQSNIRYKSIKLSVPMQQEEMTSRVNLAGLVNLCEYLGQFVGYI